MVSVMPIQEEDFVRHLAKVQSGLHSYVMSLIYNWNDADEVLQETNVVLLRKAAEFQPGTDFLRWACRVAYYEVLKHRERSQAKETLFGDDVFETLAAESLDEADAFDGKRQALAMCLESLPPTDRELIALRYRDAATNDSVAAAVGRSATAVYKALSRIRWRLFGCIRRRLAVEKS